MDAARLLGVFVIAGTIVGSSVDLAPRSFAAGQSGWSSNSPTQPATTYDRYGQPITNTAPSISQRAQAAYNDSNTAIRDGVEAGIRSANNQMSQAASGVGTQLNQQAQSWSNSAVNGLRSGAEQAANSFTTPASSSNPSGASTRGGVTSPWPTTSTAPAAATNSASRSSSAMVAANGGWTSIGTGIAAPPLLVPQSPMLNPVGTTTNFGNAGGPASRPTFPVAATNDQPTMHSVLADPARSDTAGSLNNAPSDWINNWNNQSNTPPSIGKTGNQMGSTVRDSELVPLQGSNSANSDPRSVTTARQSDNWGDSWNQPAQSSPPASIGSPSNRQANSNVSSPFGNQPIGNQGNGQFSTAANSQPQTGPALGGFNTPMNNPSSQLPNNQMAGNQMPNSQMTNGQMAGGQMPNGQMASNTIPSNTMGTTQFATNGNQGGRGQLGNGTEQQPWVPFIGAVLIMAFSLAANLYLGVSYLDARQKYQSLVRKTAETFRRVKVAA